MPATISFSTISSSSTTSVPGSRLSRPFSYGAASEPKLDSTCTLTRSFIASSTDRVCSTLAPTEASSSISS